MKQHTFLRTCGILTMISGVIDILAAIIATSELFLPAIPDLSVTGLLMVNVMFLFFALIGLYTAQYPEAGALGMAGVSLTLLALLITLLLPLPGWGLYLIGLLMFAVASTRASVLPSPAIWLWLLGACTAVVGGALDFALLYSLGFLIAGSSRIWLGYYLWNELSVRPVSQLAL